MQYVTQETPSYTNPNKRRFVVLVLVVVVGVVMLGWGITALLGNRGRSNKIPVAAHVLPEHATVRINGEQVEIKDTIYLAPGANVIEASAEGFENYSNSYLADESVNDPVLTITLLPASEEAKKYVEENEQKYAEQEGASGTAARQQGELFFQENPIAKELPFNNLVYTIGYKRTNPSDPSDQSITIEINAPIGYRNAAVNKIRQLGYDPADFNINFKNYVNPFKP